MKLEDQVCSLDLAKRLKELGVKQEAMFQWLWGREEGDVESEDDDSQNKWVLDRRDCQWEMFLVRDTAAAFTVAELGEMLPENSKCTKARGNAWLIEQYGHEFGAMENTEADGRAKMLIYLLEQGLVK